MAATRNPRARLEHVLFHIRGIEDTIAGTSYETFTSVYHMERTVERAVALTRNGRKSSASAISSATNTRRSIPK
jgi:hypothetical protein